MEFVVVTQLMLKLGQVLFLRKKKSISPHWSRGARFTHGLFLVTSYIIFLG